MALTIADGPSRGTLRVEGELDVATAPDLVFALQSARATGEDVVLDLGGLTFVDSAGLHAIVTASLGSDGHEPIMLMNVPCHVTRLLSILGLGSLPTVDPGAVEKN